MTKVEERITKNINGALFEFLGADNVERMKTEITDAIIRQVIEDLHESYEYIISPEDMVSEIVDDIVSAAKDKIRPDVEKVLYERTIAKIGL